ncbi:hypothetical protein [Microcoleus sp. CAWBG58]|uniref:hypothetical protein n=1 Tax=Microcoleus sp. CAWBG58 TaxID=2841651 RepID=UPI0025D3E78C|nr:hypothetical protein [Microcoleus sp. CAWBG58]
MADDNKNGSWCGLKSAAKEPTQVGATNKMITKTVRSADLSPQPKSRLKSALRTKLYIYQFSLSFQLSKNRNSNRKKQGEIFRNGFSN